MNFLAKDEFGSRKISDITTLDAKNWLIYLQGELGKKLQRDSLHSRSTSPSFSACGGRRPHQAQPVQLRACHRARQRLHCARGLVPTGRAQVPRFHQGRISVTRDITKRSTSFFNTGLRISEFCGLTKSDLDFENGDIRVNKQLQRGSDMRYYIERPKDEKWRAIRAHVRGSQRIASRLFFKSAPIHPSNPLLMG